MAFQPAVRRQKKLRLGLAGPPGAGKTFTALRFAFALGKRVAVIDTENGSASLYAGMMPEGPDGPRFAFEVDTLRDYSPTSYTAAINEAGRLKYDVLVIDSFTHAWAGEGGALDLKDKASAESRSKNDFFAWRDITPMHNAMIEATLRSPCHVIATLRTKVEYVMEEEQRDGRKVTVPKQIGLKPIQRSGMEYEFDIFGDIEQQTHLLKITKSRCSLIDGATVVKPGPGFLAPVIAWMNEGEDAPELPPPEKTAFDHLYEQVMGAKSGEELSAAGRAATAAKKDGRLKPAEFDMLVMTAKRRKEEFGKQEDAKNETKNEKKQPQQQASEAAGDVPF